MSLLQAGFGSSGDDYEITDSLRFRSSASAYLNRTPASTSDRTEWTWSGWVKKGPNATNLSLFSADHAGGSNAYLSMLINNSDEFQIFEYTGSAYTLRLATNALFRDPSAWYHFVCAVDTDQGTDTNRIKLYVNGVQQTSLRLSTYPSSGHTTYVNVSGNLHAVGATVGASTSPDRYLDGYLTEVNFIDGQQLTPSDFGEYDDNGTWKPLAYTGTYGTNGFYLPFNNLTSGTVSANYLTVAGGGGGGGLGGGGAGGYRTSAGTSGGGGSAESALSLNSLTSYAVTVGAGGASSGTTFNAGGDGSSSVLSTITSTGAGGGAANNAAGRVGGSGGGGSKNNQAGGAGTANQGFAGGSGGPNTDSSAGGGGGGAGAAGSNGSAGSTGNAGGAGVASAITGSSVTRAGGGGGGVGNFSATGGAGGAGGGGRGAGGGSPKNSGNNAVAGTANTGGGGGAAGFDGVGYTSSAAAGGSGVVIVSYSGAQQFNGGTVASSGGNTIHTFTTSGLLGALVPDASGNDNNWTSINLNLSTSTATTYDLMKDTPSLVDENAGNFAVMNPIDKNDGSYTDGNLGIVTGTVGGSTQRASMYFNSGKYYWEYTPISNGGISAPGFETLNSGTFTPQFYQADNGQYYNGSSASSYGATFGNNDVIGIAVDVDNRTVQFFKNNASQGTISSSNSGISVGDSIIPYVSDRNVGQTTTAAINFGQRPFKYTPPSGFLKLNTFNLPDSTIEKGDDYFNTVLYTGNNASGRNIPTGFPGGWTWIKNRNLANSHTLSDVVRGDGKTLFTNATNAEVDYGSDGIDLVSDGFDVTHSATNNLFNVTGRTYVAWNWRAGSTTTNTAGSEDSVISANTTAGFSIVSYTGTGANMTIGHGLGAVPDLMIFKPRSTADNWPVWYNGFVASRYVYLNKTSAAYTHAPFMNSTLPTSTLITLGSWANTNTNNQTYIAYCFAQKEGYSAIGSYTGNGSADGAFVYTGFRPSWLLIKQTNGGSFNWNLIDTSRSPFNTADDLLAPNANNAEVVSGFVDAVSNGFKCRNSSAYVNGSGSTYIYMAFAENPFKNANAR